MKTMAVYFSRRRRLKLTTALSILLGMALTLYLLSSSPASYSTYRTHLIMSTNKSICSEPFAYGEMCPKSYTELGGVCEMSPDGNNFTCPDIRFFAKTSLRQTQLILTRMLRLFDLVARKHQIRYWLHSGTLIGAARHNGSLPWEHDGDIEMPLEDYVKFFKVAAKDLPDDVFFQNTKSDPNLPCDSKTRHPEVGCYKRPRNPRLRDTRSCYEYCRRHGCKWHDGLQVDIFVMDSSTRAEFPLHEMTYEGFRFPVSNNWLKKLEDEFGPGIMSLPSVKEREPKARPNTRQSCEELTKAWN